MKYLKIAVVACLFAVAFAPASAFATGFGIYEQGTQATSMSGAVRAGPTDASTIFYNPAGMTVLPGVNIQLTGTMYIPTANFTPVGGAKESANSWIQVVPAAFVTWKVNPWLSLGIGEFTGFGLGIDWGDNFSGRVNAIKSQLQSFNIQPSIAFGPFKGFSIGAGFDAVLGTVDIKQGFNFGSGNQYYSELGGNAYGFGGNVGILYQPLDWMSLAATYRSRVNMKMDSGNIHFNVPTPFQQVMPPDQQISTNMWLPDVIGVGVKFNPVKALTLELDYNYYTWMLYNTVTITGKQSGVITTLVNQWMNAFDFRLGASYRYKDWKFGAGVGYDSTPVPSNTCSPMLPDNNRIYWSVGASYYFWKMHVDLAYMMVNVLGRNITNSINSPSGYYSEMVNNISLGVGFSL